MKERRDVTLRDGTPGYVRPIVPSDRAALAAALEDLAPDSRMRRFLFDKTSLSERELARLSNPDGIDHIAYGLAVDLEGEFTPIAVARCFRDHEDRTLAEIAVVTADAWQGKGAGAELMRSLSAAAYGVGVRKWLVPMFADNTGMRSLLDGFAKRLSERDLGGGIVEMVYRIREPSV
ncbi:GNAT family N-acetyltransferase [Akkermansiaceae bacterium]|nr:GNAT family N-acetyltransferase [Akkermansiaceae bacterium]